MENSFETASSVKSHRKSILNCSLPKFLDVNLDLHTNVGVLGQTATSYGKIARLEFYQKKLIKKSLKFEFSVKKKIYFKRFKFGIILEIF